MYLNLFFKNSSNRYWLKKVKLLFNSVRMVVIPHAFTMSTQYMQVHTQSSYCYMR